MAIINASRDNFLNESKTGLVVVDFWAPWCGPCKMIAPVLDEIDRELNGKAKVIKVDVDTNQDIAQEYGVMSIPTLLFLKDGEIVDKTIGFQPKEALLSIIEKNS